MPTWIPFDRLPGEVARVRAEVARSGREPDAFSIRSPGTTVVLLDESLRDQVRRARSQAVAFFVARNGEFYFNQFVRQGLEREAHAIRDAWTSGGPEAALAAMPGDMVDRFDFIGDLDACAAHIVSSRTAGVDLHTVSVLGGDARAQGEALQRLSLAG